jgi:hypothetical protein
MKTEIDIGSLADFFTSIQDAHKKGDQYDFSYTLFNFLSLYKFLEQIDSYSLFTYDDFFSLITLIKINNDIILLS